MKVKMSYLSWVILLTLIGSEIVSYLSNLMDSTIISFATSVVLVIISFMILRYFFQADCRTNGTGASDYGWGCKPNGASRSQR
ncbi:hypothetical protein B0I26_11367 [Anoxybacillus vitaminiphilus]|uniref:Uncharacterized protein n=1 Tax=Paranoxybacillus vitaminiphilus TaxID=581036 RepID=A0A327YAT9_9BACL|nr:hypothetical protein B0I26_11367 [Anoxybacillus vitaminiphilus]